MGIKQKDTERRLKVYELAKILRRRKDTREKITDIYEAIALEYGYSNWRSVKQIYDYYQKLEPEDKQLPKDPRGRKPKKHNNLCDT